MTKKHCPLGEDCDLTIAWMKGAEDARDRARSRIEALIEQLEAARLDAREAEAYSVWLERRLAKAEKALDKIAGKAPYADDPYDIARAALTELKGDKP